MVDREDVSPNDPTITKAIQFNLADSRSIGLGEALRITVIAFPRFSIT